MNTITVMRSGTSGLWQVTRTRPTGNRPFAVLHEDRSRTAAERLAEKTYRQEESDSRLAFTIYRDSRDVGTILAASHEEAKVTCPSDCYLQRREA